MGATGRQAVKQNKYERFFSTDLSSMQARGIFFILCENLNEKDMEELEAAYYPIADEILHRELHDVDTIY